MVALPSSADLVARLVDITAPEAEALFSRGEEAVSRIDREAHGIWMRIVMQMTGESDAEMGLRRMPDIVPHAVSMMFAETQRACAALHVEMGEYFRSQMAALMGKQVSVSRLENLKHTVVGVKGMHGQARAVQEHLKRVT